MELGISEHDFLVGRSKQDIRQLFERIGYSYKNGKFNAMFNRAKELVRLLRDDIFVLQAGTSEDKVNVRAFMAAVGEMHEIE